MFSRVRSFLSAWTRRTHFEDSLDEEVRFHLDAYAEDLVRSGVSRREARRRARIHFGSVEGMKDGCRQARGLRLADNLGQMVSNVRLAIRTLLKTPAATGVAVVSLALGIGSNAAIFSLYSQYLLRPLPVVEPERLVNLAAPGPKPGSCATDNAGTCDEAFSYPMFRDLQRGQSVFTDIAAHKGIQANVAYGDLTLRAQGTQVSGSYFPTLGLLPAAGRLFGPEIDESFGGGPVAVLSHDFWQADLGGAPDVIGDVLVVNGRSLTIVGVAPEGFRGTTINMPCDFFVPITMRGLFSASHDGEFENRRGYWTYLFARLEPGMSIEQAHASLEPLYRNILADVEAPLQTGMSASAMEQFLARPLRVEPGLHGQSRMHEARPMHRVALFLLFGITGGVLLIACANVANLQLARSTARTGEMAVRLSLGATRRKLLAQLLMESCLLALAAGALGLVFAHWTLRFVWTLVPPVVAEILPQTLDPYAIPFTASVSLGTAVVFGTFPALHATRTDPITALKNDAGQPLGAQSATRFRHGLIAAQFALAMMLLVTAGLFTQSLRNLNRVDFGFGTENLVTFHLWPELNGYDSARSRALFERLEAVLSAQPGVTGVTASWNALLDSGSGVTAHVMVQGFDAGPDTNREIRLSRVGTDYFRTLGIPLLAGRTFSPSDTLEAPRVAIVNESFARKFNLGRDPVGTRMGLGNLDAELDIEIVGLAGDTRSSMRNPVPPPVAYIPYRQEEQVGALWFHVRTAGPPDGEVRTIPAAVAGLDPNLPVTLLMTWSQLTELNNPDRAAAVLSTSFATLATLLAAVGLYGVLAYAVARRTREFGLRMALGADAARLRSMVLRRVGRLTLVGGAAGAAAAFGLGRLAGALLYEIEGLPTTVMATAVLVLAAVALAAGFVPAHRASRINPMTALRHQ